MLIRYHVSDLLTLSIARPTLNLNSQYVSHWSIISGSAMKLTYWKVPPDYAAKVCNLFAQLGARGASMIVGAFNTAGGDCQEPDGKPTPFWPEFPATCPFVTSV